MSYEVQFREYARQVVEGDIIEFPVRRLDIFGYTVYFWAVPKEKLWSGYYYGISTEHVLGQFRDPLELADGLDPFLRKTKDAWGGFFERFFIVVMKSKPGAFARFV